MTNPHIIRRLIASSAFLCAALVPGLTNAGPVGAAPAPAPPLPERQAVVAGEVQHYNVCGSVCRPDGEAARALQYAAWHFNANGSWVLSLNEICGTDFLELVGLTGGAGTFVVSKREASGCPDSTDEAFGNAVIALGPDQGGQAWYLPTNPGHPCDGTQPDDVECRTMLCVKRGTYVGNLGYCTSHFSSENSSTLNERKAQANEYIWLATSYTGERQRFLMGDFNLQPGDVPTIFDTNYNDLITAAAYTFNAHADKNLDRHIDYIWAVAPLIGSQWPLCPTDASDHCWTNGRPTWSL